MDILNITTMSIKLIVLIIFIGASYIFLKVRVFKKEKEKVKECKEEEKSEKTSPFSTEYEKFKLRLSEYQELREALKANSFLIWTLSTVMIPTSLLIFSYAVQNFNDDKISFYQLLTLFVFSSISLIIWEWVHHRLNHCNKYRINRMKKIENTYNMWNYQIWDNNNVSCRVPQHIKEGIEKYWYSKVQIRVIMEIYMLCITAGWVVLILFK